jgi:hypothetical protein
MDKLQEKQVNASQATIAHIRRQLDELRAYGHAPTAADQAVTDFEKFCIALEENAQTIKALRPRPDKSHEKELSGLLDRQTYLIESLESTARTAREILREESLIFFDDRNSITDGINAEIESADKALKTAYEVFAGAMQTRWKAMLRKREIYQTLSRISEEYNTTPAIGEWEMATDKPFKAKTPIFPKFVTTIFDRLSITLAGNEHTDPKDIARGAFDRE